MANIRSERLIEECFKLAPPAATSGPSRVVGLVGLPAQQRWVVVEWLETLPVDREAYGKARDVAYGTLRGGRIRQVWSDWLRSENIRRRTSYVDKRSQAQEQDEDD